jgi:3',5'-cyclic AMP phosphodiesterase CpdA
MTLAQLPFRIAQISDIHCGEATFNGALMESVVSRVNAMRPDVVLIAGDLTGAGYEWEFQDAARWLARFEPPTLAIPGNHDSRNVGYIHFEHHFGERFWRWRREFDPVRAERLRATGVTIAGADSSMPDLNEGQIGRERYGWISQQFDHRDDINIFAVHHHLVSIPGTGRERNIVLDAGDVLAALTSLEVDIVLSGHKHVPFFWGLNGMLICHSGTATTKRLRGRTPSSWNELEVDASTIKVFSHYADGRRELSAIRSRTTRRVIREAFYITQEFRESNHTPVL